MSTLVPFDVLRRRPDAARRQSRTSESRLDYHRALGRSEAQRTEPTARPPYPAYALPTIRARA